MNTFTVLLLTLLFSASDSVSLSSSSSLMTHQVISLHPSDTQVASGNKVVLNCRVENREGSCQWTKNGFGLGTDPDLPSYSRYSLENSGDHCDLIIDPVLAEDEAEFQCQVGPAAGQPGVSSNSVQVSVFHEPGVPHILQAKYGDLIEVEAGQEVTLECQTQGGKPGADVVWKHGDGSKVEAEVMDIVTRMEDERTFKTTSVLKMIPENNEDVYCEASSSMFPVPRQSPTVKIRIKDALSARLRFSKDVVKVGDDVDVRCIVENGNGVLSYTWFINNVEMKSEKLDTIRLEQVASEHDNLLIKCLANTNSGHIEVESPLVVRSPLQVTSSPGSVMANVGDMVTLQCAVSGGDVDDVSVVWTRNSDNKLIGVGEQLNLKVTQEVVGDLTCTVISGDDTVTAPAKVVLKQKPRVKIQGDKIQYISVGESAVLSCHVENYYDGTLVTWYKGNKKLNSDGTKYRIVQHKDQDNNELLKTDLVILNVQDDDFARYKCEASNEQGQDNGEIDLENENGGYWVISLVVNIVGAIFVSGFIGVFLYMRRKQRSNVEFMEEEKQRYLKNQIFKGWDKSPLDKLLVKNQNFNIDLEFNCDEDDLNESSMLNLKKPKRINRFYSAPNGSFQSDNTVISFINDDE